MTTDQSSIERSQPPGGTAPRLVAVSPPELEGATFELTSSRILVGRGEKSDLHLDNSTLSRTHALIERSVGQTVVSDLNSTNGTFLNGSSVGSEPRSVADGDVVRFGELELRYEDPTVDDDATRSIPVPSSEPAPTKTEYHIDDQQAEVLNNVGRDQYNAYYQYVQQQRESFARDIAATKTKARRLIVVGFLIFVLGLAGYFVMFVGAFKTLSNASADNPSAFENFWGPKAGGVPVGLIGFAVATIGLLLMIVGIVLHIVAASRRRQFETRNPVPPPPWVAGPPPQWSP